MLLSFQDPLLLVPRNEGACLWAPAVPFSTTPACTVNTSSFSCRLHTNGGFTLERSKSDVQAHRHFHSEYSKTATFYTDDTTTTETKEVISNNSFALERSKTSALFSGSVNHVDPMIFDNRPAYSRAAPSPPARTKLSPSTARLETNHVGKMFSEQGHFLGTTGILDATPVPPKRKVSPKNLELNNVGTSADTNRQPYVSSDDLIKF